MYTGSRHITELYFVFLLLMYLMSTWLLEQTKEPKRIEKNIFSSTFAINMLSTLTFVFKNLLNLSQIWPLEFKFHFCKTTIAFHIHYGFVLQLVLSHSGATSWLYFRIKLFFFSLTRTLPTYLAYSAHKVVSLYPYCF